MFLLDNIDIATRNFGTRKLRTFLTVLGISVGIGTTLFLVSLGYGLQKVLLEKIAKSDALLTLDVASVNPSMIRIDRQAIRDLSQIPGVTKVSPQQVIMSQISYKNITNNVKLSSVDSAFFSLGGIEFLSGKKYEGKKDNKVVLSTGALATLGLEDTDQALGKEVSISLLIPQEGKTHDNDLMAENNSVVLNQRFQISGIVDDPSESSGFIPSGWAEELAPDHYEEVKIKVDDQKNLDSVRNTITEKGFSVMALTDTVDQANKIFFVFQIILATFGVVALTVSAIGMFNTMTIALLERTNEIGIMKAIGASKREIRFLFLTESVLIGFLGGLGGVIIGLVASRIFNFLFNLLAKRLGGLSIEIFYTPFWFVVFIILFSTVIGLITGIYPSIRASRLNPLVALRNK